MKGKILPLILLFLLAFSILYFANIKKDKEVVFHGKLHSRMTYGRAVFENLDERANFKYFIVEPHDYTEDGVDKYSPTIRNLKNDEVVMIKGSIYDDCWWNDGVKDTNYKGCVPWIESKESHTYHCPEYYNTKEEYADDVNRFTDDYREYKPRMAEAEIVTQRYLLVESACGYPPIYEL